jgi:hypothetical protein
MPEVANRQEERSDTKLKRGGQIKDQGRIVEAQNGAPLHTIERTDMGGRRLNRKGQRCERNPMYRCGLHKGRMHGRGGLAAIFSVHPMGTIHGVAALHCLIWRHHGGTVKSISRKSETEHGHQNGFAKTHRHLSNSLERKGQLDVPQF